MLLLSSWKTHNYMSFDGIVHQQIVGIHYAQLIADFALYCYERDFMSHLHKSKQYDLIDMFKDTFQYLDGIFTIDSPKFEKRIPDI